MKERLLDLICCPSCKGELTLNQRAEREKGEIKEGRLNCSCGKDYIINNFIPRFIDSDAYVGSFSFEWHRHRKTQLDSYTNSLYSEEKFKTKTGFPVDELKNKLVLDVGCGVGRYAEIVNKYGSEVVGIDMSYAIDTAFENMGLRGKVHFIQADIFNLPFKPGTFDYIFSIGVILINPHWYNNDAAPKG